jgi:hypothetical protein
MNMTHDTREGWLTAAIEELRPIFEAVGKPLPKAIRVACGFPLNAKRSKAIGECWIASASADGTIEILISPVLSHPLKVFEVLVHELCHATSGAFNHGINFQKTAALMGLAPAGGGRETWKATTGNSTFSDSYGSIIDGLLAYPHSQLTYADKKTQGTRMLKAVCPSCAYTVRLTAKWAAQGLPTCPCGDTLSL